MLWRSVLHIPSGWPQIKLGLVAVQRCCYTHLAASGGLCCAFLCVFPKGQKFKKIHGIFATKKKIILSCLDNMLDLRSQIFFFVMLQKTDRNILHWTNESPIPLLKKDIQILIWEEMNSGKESLSRGCEVHYIFLPEWYLSVTPFCVKSRYCWWSAVYETLKPVHLATPTTLWPTILSHMIGWLDIAMNWWVEFNNQIQSWPNLDWNNPWPEVMFSTSKSTQEITGLGDWNTRSIYQLLLLLFSYYLIKWGNISTWQIPCW